MNQYGYKQTEIGVIPEDWDCVAAKQLMKIETGSRNTEHKTDIGKYPFFVRSQKVERIDTYHYDCEAVLTAGDGVGTGKVFHHYIGKFDAHQRVYVMSNFDGITGRFFFNYFSENFGKEVSKYTAKSSVDSVRRDMIAEMLIPTPPIPEQEQIAEALSDVDIMISSLEKLIAKKKAIKQGAMQELLTGKKRLPGFDGEWKECVLGDLCYLITKQTGFDYTNEIKPALVDINSNGTLPFIQNKDFSGKKINTQTDYYIPYDVALKYPRILLDETCLLVSLSGRIGNVGLYEKSNGLSFIGGAVGICRFNKEQNAEWCMLYLQSSSGQKQIFECQKSGAQHNLTVEDVRKLVVKLPSTLEEQMAIASILSDMDNEIEALEQKLEKTRQIKQGMMQQLLTGKIRLV
jgi:type I restriction enzyme S subunit